MKIQIDTRYQLFFLIALFLFSQSCNVHVEKRRYRKGYYVEVSNTNKNDKSINRSVSSQVFPQQTQTVPLYTPGNEIRVDSLKKLKLNFKPKNEIYPVISKKKKRTVLKIENRKDADDKCDIIHLTDGTEIEALIVNITSSEITYKKCNFETGPTYKTSSSKVKSIDLRNGEVYYPPTNVISTNQSSGEITGGMIATIVLAGIAFICIITAIIIFLTTFFLIAAIPLAIAGITSLVGFIIAARYLTKESHGLGKAAFYSNLVLQVIAIILTVLMFVLFF